jgi:hypothetical protein
MKSMNHFDSTVWSRFLDFVFPDERSLSREEVQAELKRLRVDVHPSLEKLSRILQQARESEGARGALVAAKKRRSSLLARLIGIEAASGSAIRETLKEMIVERLAGPEQAVYARKLENAASDEDLRSLLDDISRLQAFSEEAEDDAS